ncbi:FmdB family zinc ribbon protein [Spirillospora sp. NPDC127200]
MYEYRCPECGPFTVGRPMGGALPDAPCPGCAAPARRVFGAPSLSRTPRPLARALAAQEQSADRPRVVEGVPPARRPPAAPADPRQARLPRP